MNRKWRKRVQKVSPSAVAVGLCCVVVAVVWGVLLAISPGESIDIPDQPDRAAQPVIGQKIPKPASLVPARHVLSSDKPVTVSVLGDSTGNASGEWVDLWAQRLASDHAVTEHLINSTLLEWSSATNDYGTGPAVTIWNAGVPGAAAEYPIPRLGKLQPEKPDLVIYSLGHNNSADNIADQMGDLTAAVQKRWGDVPEVAILQNPRTFRGEDHEQTIPALRDWALFSRTPFVDVHAAFAGRPLGSLLLDDGIHPNGAGSALWAQTVAKALG